MKSEKQLYRWDVNQYLTELQPEAQFVDYPMGNEVIRIETDGKRCRIPDEFLQTSGFKTCYERYSDGTYKAYSFNVLSSPKPPDYVYTVEERTTFESLVEKTDAAIAEIKRRADSGEFTPVKGVDYFTEAEKNELMESVSSGAVGEFRKVVDGATTEYNDNHNLKLAKYNANASEKLTTYDTNAEQHTTDYNRNAEFKLEAYNQNHTEKVAEYNQNAETKTAEFDSNAAALQTEVDRLRGECDTLAAENRKQESRIDALIKLNKGQTYDILPEEGETASRTAPSGAKYVSVDKVGGKSIVWNQLCNPDEFSYHGSKVSESDGIVTITECESNNRYKAGFIAVTKGHKYYQTVKIKSDGVNPVGFQNYLFFDISDKTTSAEFTRLSVVGTCTGSGDALVQLFSSNATDYQIIKDSFMLFDLTLLFGAGNEPTAEQFEAIFPAESYPYNPGEIVSSTTKTVDFTPGNIYPGTKATTYFPCKISKGETFTVSAMCRINTVKARYTSEDGSQKDYYTLSDLVGTYVEGKSRYKRRIKAPFDISRLMFDVPEGESASDFVVEIGEGDGTYKRYFEPAQITTGFPELRSAMAAHDYIDMDGGKVRRKIKSARIDDKNAIYSVRTDQDNCCRVVFTPETSPGIVISEEPTIPSNIISDKLATITHNGYWSADAYTGIEAYPGYASISMRLQDRTDLDTKEKVSAWLKANPMTVYYEINPEEVTDVQIPEALQEWLPVEPGGTVTFKNSDDSKQLAIPNAVSWVRKLNEVE